MLRPIACLLLCALYASSAHGEEISPPPPVRDISPVVAPADASPSTPKVISIEAATMRKPLRFIEVQDLPAVNMDPAQPVAQGDPDALPNADDAPVQEILVSQPMPYVKLHGIRKMTGRMEPIQGEVGDVLRFADLELVAHQCRTMVDQGERGFVALVEVKLNSDTQQAAPLFRGWLFSTTPSLSSMQHPLYDLLLMGCEAKPVAVDKSANKKK